MKVFVAGPRALRSLNSDIAERLNNIIEKEITVLVGDANGVDKMTQQFFCDTQYRNVLVYASNGTARNNIGNWEVVNVPVKDNAAGFAFYAEKDKAMANEADYGFMIWNGKSKGTLNNIINLTKQDKTVLVYLTPHKKFYNIKNLDAAKTLAYTCGDDAKTLFNSLAGIQPSQPKVSEQLSLYHNVV